MPALPTSALTQVAGPALALALSPIPVVIVVIVLVHNQRPRVSSAAYLLGRITALATLELAFSLAPVNALHLPHWAFQAKLIAGVTFLAAGIAIWRSGGAKKPSARWHARVGGISPSTAAALGLLPPLVNPKTVAASIAASSAIRTLPIPTAATTLICYLSAATSTIIAPVIVYLTLGTHIDPKLETLRCWLLRHQNTTTAATFATIGVTMLLPGPN